MENNTNTILAIVAHPDDAEFTCAGTLALFKQKGWHIEMATMTAGDCGSAEHSREEISKIRKKEAASAAEIIDGNYHCLEADDIFLMYDRPTLLKTIALIRKTKPKIVLTMSPSCYMVDHETTSLLAQTACFSAGIINIKTDDIPPYYFTPYLYYVDPMEGKDKFGNQVKATTIVDISEVMDIKEKMLKSHNSQQSWLMSHNGMDEYTLTMKELSEKRGAEISTQYAEGFRQHLGHAFPQGNIIKQVLGELVVASDKSEFVS